MIALISIVGAGVLAVVCLAIGYRYGRSIGFVQGQTAERRKLNEHVREFNSW